MASITTSSIAQTSELAWAGLVHETVTNDGDEAWTVEDGGRIRSRDASVVWTFGTTPIAIEDTLGWVFVLDAGGNHNARAVAQSGYVTRQTNGGVWLQLTQQEYGSTAPEQFLLAPCTARRVAGVRSGGRSVKERLWRRTSHPPVKRSNSCCAKRSVMPAR